MVMALCRDFLGGSTMELGYIFLVNSLLLGVGLAMDAFSVSIADGLSEPKMRLRKTLCIAGTFAAFQALMPLIGWAVVHFAAERFNAFNRLIPWIALLLLGFIGGKMLYEGFHDADDSSDQEIAHRLTPTALMIQGIATSIDALSVGFTISDHSLAMALLCAAIIAAVTFAISLSGLKLGKKIGNRLSNKASILGGVILIAIGIEIFIKGLV